jgi:alkanesulfonate monooxygenase SsuD/methylene tetrahydromethanopterin reductase-like flavin-dependent oxidoreductase (luciferase family)
VKVGIINAVRMHPDRAVPIADLYRDFVGDAELAEELGFDFSWYGEHHFRPCQWTPSPLVVCAAVAARTERLRVGTSVVCLPFHDPLRIAEDAATVDALSAGRLDLGLGVGSQWEEFNTFGVDPAEMNGRLWEGADLIWRCFTETGRFTHEGRYYAARDVEFTTKPVQEPVPFWVGTFGPGNVRRTAERGWHLLAGDFSGVYDATLAELGRDADGFGIAPMQQVCVADTTDAAYDASLEGLHYFVNFYLQRKQLDGSVPPPEAELTREAIRAGALSRHQFTSVVGTPDEVRPHFEALAAGVMGRITHLPVGFRHAGMTNDAVRRSMELFAAEVLPILR